MQNGYPGNGNHNWRRNNQNRNSAALYVETGPYYQQQPGAPNEVDPGMNGEGGWQPGGRGGSHHMNGGGGRRGGGMHNQNRMPPNQHHGGMNRMMPPGFRHQPQQSQYMNPYPMGGMPGDMMDISMRMGDMSLAQSNPNQVMSGGYQDMGPPPPQQGGWNQPAPFAPQEELYDPAYGAGIGHNMPPHHVPFGQRGGGNQYGGRMQSNRQGGGYQRGNHQQQNGGYMQPMMVPPMGAQTPVAQQYYGGGGYQSSQPSAAPSPFSMSSSMSVHENQMGGSGNQSQNGFSVSASSMDDYSMWTDENDEDAKRKKILRDKGLLAWGDADVSNAKPIRRWIVPEGHEEDFEVAMARCPSHLKKKSLNEEALRRRLGSDNPQVVAQAQQQAEEEAAATIKVGRRPIIPCGWGDLPSDLVSGDKSDYDQGSSKGWDEASLNGGNGMKNHMQHQQQQHHDEGLSGMPWNLPGVVGGPSSSETRNPFFAHHMQQQQQQQQQHHHQHQHQLPFGGYVDADNAVWSAGIDGAVMQPPSAGPMSSVPLGMLSMASAAAVMGGGASDEDGSQRKLADSLKLAVENGHLDISLLSLPHIPPNVLDLLTEILTVIPRLDGHEDELNRLLALRPSTFEPGTDPEKWMNKEQKNEHDKVVIGVVTSKIEVGRLSKKINAALIESGLIPPPMAQPAGTAGSQSGSHQGPPPPPGPDGGASGPSSSRDTTFNTSSGGPPDHYYDYSFLG